jgi:uncharacterized protein with PIN domain
METLELPEQVKVLAELHLFCANCLGEMVFIARNEVEKRALYAQAAVSEPAVCEDCQRVSWG